jgi:hypothetical protein
MLSMRARRNSQGMLMPARTRERRKILNRKLTSFLRRKINYSARARKMRK